MSEKKLIKNFNNNFNNINFSKIKKFKIIANKFYALLQVADICSSSFHHALKYNEKNNKYYYDKLKNKLSANKAGKTLGYGIKLVPKDGDFKEIYNLL